MPRANRYWVDGAAYHLTHRCHDRAYLLRFARDRDAYRSLLRDELRSSTVFLLNYTITSNHVHLLVTSDNAAATATLIQAVHGRFAESYNRRKGRQGAFWSDRYHATQIADGAHLWACLAYIDLNMVRAGAVPHPREWPWTGWHELTGQRRRNRLIDRSALLARLGGVRWSDFEARYRAFIDDTLMQDGSRRQREEKWTESIAVGDAEFVRRIEANLVATGRRSQLERRAMADGVWILRENGVDYGERVRNGSQNSPEEVGSHVFPS